MDLSDNIKYHQLDEFSLRKKLKIRSWVVVSLVALVLITFTLYILRGISVTFDPIDRSKFSKIRKGTIKSSDNNWRLNTNREYNVTSWETSSTPQIREYDFNITNIIASPDGVTRNMTVINGQFPGPLVQANIGDTLRIKVRNNADEPTSIHFHGLFFKNTNYYDGASSMNQCEIPTNHTFVYEFEVEQYGTYWYHSHYSTQAADGIVGPVVLHSIDEDEHLKDQYDQDLVVLISDHYHDKAENYLEDYLAPNNENDEPTPDNGLIQGANYFEYPENYYRPQYNVNESMHHTFILRPDQKYRLRIINVGFFADIDYTIDEHPLIIIEADGTLVKPFEVDVLNIAPAQRYSVIIETNKSNSNNLFWMHAKLNSYCFAYMNSWLNIDTRALVLYGEPSEYQNELSLIEANSIEYQYYRNIKCRELDETLLKPLIKDPAPAYYDQHHRLDAWFNIGAYQLDRGKFNQTSYIPIKDTSTLYKQVYNLSSTDVSLTQDGAFTPYPDQFMINIHENNTVVDLLINNLDDGSHPFHLHGHKFWVVKVGSGNFNFKEYDEINIEDNEYIKRDTIHVEGYKYAVIRFIADNPGIWPFHCHIGWHMEAGLVMQLNIMPNVYRNWEFPDQWNELCELQEAKYLSLNSGN
ncbi:hypothetical protein WICMUC_001466 [Wickerhamomyces mucosus]|uniref:Multicopper oxidase n=1 Tax=Wickerhamomyces mucosus TaxID=1378264 RepID=A0A9P8PWB1_9ASCO|nr:hypothetical protein WICMUC_001466 [Wickerhamomyces mucosus]